MNVPASQLNHLPVLSLQSNETIGRILRPVVLCANLQIIALRCEHNSEPGTHILRIQDIRQLAPDCLVVNADDDLVLPEDIIRLRATIRDDYDPIGKPVVTEMGQRLGIVKDYLIDTLSSRIQTLIVKPPLFSPRPATNHIDRGQITDVTNSKITVRDSTVAADTMPEGIVPNPAG